MDVRDRQSESLFEKGPVLVVGPAWVGDLVMTQSLLKVLKTQEHIIGIDVVAPPLSFPLLMRMPEVRQPIALPLGHGDLGLKTRWHLGKTLRSERYSQAIVLPNSFKAGILPFAAQIKRRTGYLGEMRWGLLNDIRYQFNRVIRRDIRPHGLIRTVDSFVMLGLHPDTPLPNPMPLPRLTVDQTQFKAVMTRFDLDPTVGPVVALCPGAAFGPAKRWPASYFSEVAKTVIKWGYQVWLFGGDQDKACHEIKETTGKKVINLAGQITLTEAVDLLSGVTAVITNDSGLMHVAAALDRPVIALFGSSDPNHTPPLHAEAVILCRHLPCSPCLKRTCSLGHMECLRGISPNRVLAELKKLLSLREKNN